MTAHATQFEGTASDMVLTNAILLYRAAHGGHGQQVAAGTAFASIHKVEHNASQPTIAAGEPLTRAHLRQWTEALGRNVAPEILPDNVLVSHPDMLAWWVPEKVRASYFALTNPPPKLKALSQRTTLALPYPAHLFVATRRGLGVYALRENRRPIATTPLLHSPVLNVFLRGSLCWGNIPQPKTLAVSAMAEYERAVFDSWSTHPNPGQELTVTGKGGLVRLWDDLAAKRAKRFPVDRLKPFDPSPRRDATEPFTLGKIVGRAAR
ncbi:PRTRC system protein B [Sphingomonas sp. MMS24-J13]|uniref:PRTRC system protein B n=1 Tax=Sphingomonas sp. MMS24-J13 TaxID=3238686 RepID=UPI00384F80C2